MTVLVFDIDGVVLDSPHELTWRKALERLGIEGFTSEIYNKLAAGIPRKPGAYRIIDTMNLLGLLKLGESDRDNLADLLCTLKQEFMEKCIDRGDVKVFPSAVNMLKEAKSRGIKTVAASSSKNARRILDKIGIYSLFDYDVSGRRVNGKPAPDIFLLAAEAANVLPEDCVVMEDSPAGVQAAKAAGMFCIGVASHGYRDVLRYADIVVNDLSEIKLDNLIGGWENDITRNIALRR